MKVYIKPEVHAFIMYHVNKSAVEVSGLGKVEKTSDGNLIVTKAYLLEQENTATSTDLCEDAVANLMYEAKDDAGEMTFWWHSHVEMDVFWSSTDMETIYQFGENGYLLATVFNKKGKHKTAYYQKGDNFFPSCWLDDLDTSFSYIPTEDEIKQWEKEHNEKCKRATFKYPSGWSYQDEWADWKYNKKNKKGKKDKNIQDIDLLDFYEGYKDPAYGETFTDEDPLVIIDKIEETFDPEKLFHDMSVDEQTLYWDMFTVVKGYYPHSEDEIEDFYGVYADNPHILGIDISLVKNSIGETTEEKLNQINNQGQI